MAHEAVQGRQLAMAHEALDAQMRRLAMAHEAVLTTRAAVLTTHAAVRPSQQRTQRQHQMMHQTTAHHLVELDFFQELPTLGPNPSMANLPNKNGIQ